VTEILPTASDVGSCVLIVDDEPDIREALSEVVEMGGCAAIVASNGAEALELLRAGRRPCLVILDLLMPVMTGCELLEAIRREPALSAVRVLVSTSAPDRAPAGVPVLPKPVDLTALWSWMRRTCTCASHAPAG
jgi:CheY-like chemotaxis protein